MDIHGPVVINATGADLSKFFRDNKIPVKLPFTATGFKMQNAEDFEGVEMQMKDGKSYEWNKTTKAVAEKSVVVKGSTSVQK